MAKKAVTLVAKILIALVVVMAAGSYPAFLLARHFVNNHFERWGTKLVDLEKRGLLSKEYGAGWQDVLTDQAMDQEAARITDNQALSEDMSEEQVQVVDGISLSDYPSLSIIDRLREVREYSSTIEIVDRLGRSLSNVKTDHLRARIDEFPKVLVVALLAAEDKNFRENTMGFEFDSFVRAMLRSVKESVLKFKKVSPRGTSTITQQVAKLFISKLDEQGMRQVSRSVDRKVRELRLAVALRKLYSADDLLEVYMNHCVTSDFGMIGYKDIARGLFNKDLSELNDAECIYLARMVKWGRNLKTKIVSQCRIDMGRMGDKLHWSPEKRQSVLAELDSIQFCKPRRFEGGYGSLVDLANEFWLLTLERNGSTPEQLSQMNLLDPNSLVRKKGNLKIQLSLDSALQVQVEKMVNSRGYGPDTTIIDEVRIGSQAGIVKSLTVPRDTIRAIQVLTDSAAFSETGSSFVTHLGSGDTVVVNIRYKRTAKNEYRRSCFFYVLRPVRVNGQYFAYSIMDSKSGKLLAYYSRDLIGSRLACLLRNRTPNGSSTAKPILNAINYDLGFFKPYSKWTDTVDIFDDVPWKRKLNYHNGKVIGVVYENSAVKGRGYPVHNHGSIFEGCQYVFDLLASSNNILAVETLLRLNKGLFQGNSEINSDAFQLVQYLYRTGSFSRVKDSLKLKSITGVRAYKELARIVGVDVDTMNAYGRRSPVSDSMYSVALGTMELTLYEQMHLYNIFHNNDLIERPADHPSLVIEQIVLNGNQVTINDTIRRFHPFSDINNVRPSILGMHKRLISNRAEGLAKYDIPYQLATDDPVFTDSLFNSEALLLNGPLSNFAKSGTTDDIIRPYDSPASSKKKTNYGMWNAVLRVDLSKFGPTSEPELRDLTVSCIGECNVKHTGVRDGKTLHRFMTSGLLKIGGVAAPDGFYSQYENYIKKVTPPGENCGNGVVIENVSTDVFEGNTIENGNLELLGD